MLRVTIGDASDGGDITRLQIGEHLSQGLRWSPARTDLAIAGASRRGWIVRANGHLELTRPGREIAQRVIAR